MIALPGLTSPGIGLIDDPFDKGLLSSDARVRAFNASANATNLDLYIVPAGTNINTVSPTMAGVSVQQCGAGKRPGLAVSVGRHVCRDRHGGGQQDADLPVRGVQSCEQRRLAGDDGADRRAR